MMYIPLFTFHLFGRVIVCVRYGLNCAQKQRLGGKKTTRCCNIQCYKQNETVHGKKRVTDMLNIVYLKLPFPRDAA